MNSLTNPLPKTSKICGYKGFIKHVTMPTSLIISNLVFIGESITRMLIKTNSSCTFAP